MAWFTDTLVHWVEVDAELILTTDCRVLLAFINWRTLTALLSVAEVALAGKGCATCACEQK